MTHSAPAFRHRLHVSGSVLNSQRTCQGEICRASRKYGSSGHLLVARQRARTFRPLQRAHAPILPKGDNSIFQKQLIRSVIIHSRFSKGLSSRFIVAISVIRGLIGVILGTPRLHLLHHVRSKRIRRVSWSRLWGIRGYGGHEPGVFERCLWWVPCRR